MIYFLDEIEVDQDKQELRRSGSIVPVEPLVFRVLTFLIVNRERVISKQDLIDSVWDGRAVSDWTVSGCIKSVRSVLGDTGKSSRFVRTIHGKGYRFVASVRTDSAAAIGVEPMATIAALPFDNLSGQADQQYLANGITEDLITDLSSIRELSVVSRNAVFAFRHSEYSAKDIAQRLQARFLIQGSVQLNGENIRINARLTDVETDKQLWADRITGSRETIFQIQDELCRGVLSSLKLKIVAPHSSRNGRGTSDPEAYDHCLRGRSEYFQYTPAHLAKAQTHFEEASVCDPDYAEAWAYQSYCRTSAYVFTWPGADDTLQPAIALAEKAIALDPGSAVAQARLGWVLGFVGRFDEAVDCFNGALALNDRNAEVYYAFGETMNRRADPEKALGLLDAAFRIDTFVPPAWEFAKGHSRILLGQYDAALEHVLPVLERVPRFIPARVQLARAYWEMDRHGDARSIIESIIEFAPRYRLRNAKRMFPYPSAKEQKRLVSALQAAGLPE